MSARPGYEPYEPLLALKSWGENIWTVDGPEIGYSFAGLRIPCPTRMTIIKLKSGDLWVHSPVQWTQALAESMSRLGPIKYLIAPNLHHFAHLRTWARNCPNAEVFAPPLLAQRLERPEWQDIACAANAPWHGEIAQVHFPVSTFAETVFFHRLSRTVIVTDLMQNFEATRIANPLIRLVLWAGGATGPSGQASIDMRMALRRHRKVMRAGVEALLALAPERIILAHGRCYQEGALREIERAFAYLR